MLQEVRRSLALLVLPRLCDCLPESWTDTIWSVIAVGSYFKAILNLPCKCQKQTILTSIIVSQDKTQDKTQDHTG